MAIGAGESISAVAGYGAIAWDRGTGKYGVSWNQPTPQRAMEVAVGDCGASNCKVVGKPVRVRIKSRSNSAGPPNTVSISLPCEVVVS